MSLRQSLLQYLLANTEATLDEIQEGIGEKSRKRVADNVANLVRDGLATRQRDVVTNLPSYKITTAGEKAARAAEEPPKEEPPKEGPQAEAQGDVIAQLLEDLRALAAERDALRKRLHDQGNDLAAANLVMEHLANRLQVEAHVDIPQAMEEQLHALSTRAVLADAPQGAPALLLIDHTDLTEVEHLPPGMNPREIRAEAERAIREGHAARVLAVHIIGEAQRAVEWKEAV